MDVTGVWSHLACSDEPTHPANAAQLAAFADALAIARDAGLTPLAHLANSAAALYLPEARHDLVRLGIAAYGQAPAPALDSAEALGLRPVMRVTAPLISVKQIPAGTGVSYGHTYVADSPRIVGLVPVGYADGIPGAASGRGVVGVRGQRAPILGRVCMDQFVVDLTDVSGAAPGDEVTLWGDDPSAQDWAEAADTINYEIVTRVGGRFERRVQGGAA